MSERERQEGARRRCTQTGRDTTGRGYRNTERQANSVAFLSFFLRVPLLFVRAFLYFFFFFEDKVDVGSRIWTPSHTPFLQQDYVAVQWLSLLLSVAVAAVASSLARAG